MLTDAMCRRNIFLFFLWHISGLLCGCICVFFTFTEIAVQCIYDYVKSSSQKRFANMLIIVMGSCEFNCI